MPGEQFATWVNLENATENEISGSAAFRVGSISLTTKEENNEQETRRRGDRRRRKMFVGENDPFLLLPQRLRFFIGFAFPF